MAHFDGGLLILGALILALATAPLAAAEAAPPGDVLKTLRPGHPRLYLAPDVLDRLRRGVQADPQMKEMLGSLRASADKMLGARPIEHVLIGPRLLDKSRTCLDRVSTLALIYQLTGDRKYADRAVRELEAAAAFKDWNPSHFLDTAEMSCAFGIGYDWLYACLSDAQRQTVRAALVEKGLTPGLESYRGTGRYGWWTRAHHNWSQVCNGGLAVGALAIADEEPKVAAEILASGLKAVVAAMANFGPDGSWNEGPGYWGYTLHYTSNYLDALRTGLGSMMDLDKSPGLSEAGIFRIYFIGPTGRTFNFADAHEGAGSAPSMFWLARTFAKPVCAWHERQVMRPSAFDLIWFTPEGQGPRATGLPLHKYFPRDEVVFMRSAWEDPQALWLGFKGGDNAANHSHLDIGSFVLDALGQRWATDLGSDDYNLPAYFGAKRWTYFRLKTESHNTLVLNGENQATRAKAPVVAFAQQPDGGACAVVDLSQAYPQAKAVHRGIWFHPRSVIVQDEVRADTPVEVLWNMVTRAKVRAEGRQAVLEQGGTRLFAAILDPTGAARFETLSANPPPPERQQPDATRLVVRLPAKVAETRIVVSLSPEQGQIQGLGPGMPALDQWPGRSAKP